MLKRFNLINFGLFFLLLAIALLASGVGAAKIGNIFNYLSSDYSDTNKAIMESIRIPRIVTAILAGFLMALAGLLMQRIFHNPLAEPTILGTTAAASFGSIIAIAIGANSTSLLTLFTASAFSATVISFLIITLATRVNAKNLTLIIVGFALAALLNGLISVVSAATGNQQIRSISFWTSGTLAYSTSSTFYLLLVVSITAALMVRVLQKRFDLLALSPIQNLLLNINPIQTKRVGLLIVSFAVAAVTVSVGAIAFVGLAAPYISKAVFGSSIKDNYIGTALMGSILLLLSDTVARGLIPPTELPVSVITSLVGAPILILIILKRRSFENA